MKVGVISLGCAKNLVDTEHLLGMLNESDVEIVTDRRDADAIIINTCGFIEPAKKEAIDTILDVADFKDGKLKKLIVMGCLAQRYKAQLEEEMPEVDRFIAIDEYNRLHEILTEELGVRIINSYGKAPRMLSGKPWMAYLRIADGCDNRCSYCAIPLIRGPLRSYPEDEIVKEAEMLVQNGVKELNLIAQDSSRYGYDIDGQLHLSHLLKRLDAIEGVKWIRILYLYPDEIPDDLIETIKNSRHILPYFDIPVQHGSDNMLRAMHRRGNRKLILERVETIRRQLPDAILRTTVICGFPHETEEDHALNLSMISLAGWDHLGAFTFSSEEDTPAYEMEDDVPEEVKQKRKQEVMALQKEIADKRFAEWLGREDEVLVESRDPLTGMYIGRSKMHAPDDIDGCVRFRGDDSIEAGDFVKVRYRKIGNAVMIADMLER